MKQILAIIAVIVLSAADAFAGAPRPIELFNVPTLSEWGMVAAAAGLMLVGVFFAVRRRKGCCGE